jgi:hypothetical protein
MRQQPSGKASRRTIPSSTAIRGSPSPQPILFWRSTACASRRTPRPHMILSPGFTRRTTSPLKISSPVYATTSCARDRQTRNQSADFCHRRKAAVGHCHHPLTREPAADALAGALEGTQASITSPPAIFEATLVFAGKRRANGVQPLALPAYKTPEKEKPARKSPGLLLLSGSQRLLKILI